MDPAGHSQPHVPLKVLMLSRLESYFHWQSNNLSTAFHFATDATVAGKTKLSDTLNGLSKKRSLNIHTLLRLEHATPPSLSAKYRSLDTTP